MEGSHYSEVVVQGRIAYCQPKWRRGSLLNCTPWATVSKFSYTETRSLPGSCAGGSIKTQESATN